MPTEKELKELFMRVDTLETSVDRLVDAQTLQSNSLNDLTKSVNKLIITLDRGKWFAIGVLLALAALFGNADKIESIIKILS